MPRGSTYANTSQNRSLGRVGMTMGSMPVSRTSGGSSGGSYSSGFSSSSITVKTYVDNEANRRIGRAGMEHGTMVVSKSNTKAEATSAASLGSPPVIKCYTDNPFNRRAGRVGKPIGTHVLSNRSKEPIQKTYGDNENNRELGLVGKLLGSEPQSQSKKSPCTGLTREMFRNCITDIEMPRGSTYANTSQNRSLGRVGMTMGSMPVSRTSGGSSGGSYSSGFSSSSITVKTYVDNAQNRSLGRVGMEHGSIGSTYADTLQNRSLGRVGLSMGSMPVSRSSGASSGGSLSSGSSSNSSSVKTYVDNAQNRSLGRVGMEHGSMPASLCISPGSKNSTSHKTYVDNEANRRIGRAGMEHGTMVVSKSNTKAEATSAASLGSPPVKKCYTDNPFNRRVGRVGKPIGTHVLSTPAIKCYTDNAFNRRAGRVGKPIGTHVLSNRSKEPIQKTYGDNENNRELGLVGQLLGSEPQSQSKISPCTGLTREMFRHCITDIDIDYEDARDDELATEAADRAIEAWNRIEIFEQKATQQEKKIPFEDYEGKRVNFSELQFKEENKIGHGGFGDVFAAKWNGTTVAVKKLRVQRVSKARLKQFDEEITLFCKLNHPNITRFLGACLTTPNICMIMEFMQGSLYDKLHIEEYEFDPDTKLDIVRGTISGLSYLHDTNLAHCDIKSSNILLNIFDSGIVTKITDFGLSMMKSDCEMSTSSKNVVKDIGTPRYSAPEILNGDLLNIDQMMKADIYAFGLVVFEVFSEEEPYSNLNYNQLKKHVGQKGLRPNIENTMDIDQELVRLVKRCWDEFPFNRPTAEECQQTCENCL